MLENLDDEGKEFLNNFIVNVLNISDESLSRYFKDIKSTVIARSRTYNVKSFRKSEKNRLQVVYQTLTNCKSINYRVGNKKRKFFLKKIVNMEEFVYQNPKEKESRRVPQLYQLAAK